MAWIIELVVFFAWTAPKFGVTGTDAPPSTICCANGATSGSVEARASSIADWTPGKYPVSSAHFSANSPVVMSLTNCHARSAFFVVLKTERCEPPSTDGAMPPSSPGITAAPILPSSSGFASMRAFGVHEPESIMATLPCVNESRRSVSFHVVAPADEKPCSVASPV